MNKKKHLFGKQFLVLYLKELNKLTTIEVNYNMISSPGSKPFIGGAFMASTYDVGNVISTQEANLFLLGKASD